MTSWRFALAALALGCSTAALAAPAAGPNSLFTGGDLFDLEVATDPQISPDGRTIAYVRKTNDIMTDRARTTIWLVDVTAASSGRSSPAPVPIRRRAGRPTARASPTSAREGGSTQLYVRWMAGGESARIPASPTAPTASPGRPTAAASVIRCSSPTRAQARLGAGQARRRQMGRPAADHRRGHLPRRRRRLSEARLQPDFLVPADGGAPRQLTFGATHAGGADRLDPRRPRDPVQRQLSKNWERESGRERDLPRRHRRRRAGRADHPQGPRRRAGSLARRPHDRLLGFDDRQRGYENTSSRDGPRRLQQARR